MLSLRMSHVECRMISAMTRPIIGSIMFHPVNLIAIPEIITPTDTSVSASMCM